MWLWAPVDEGLFVLEGLPVGLPCLTYAVVGRDLITGSINEFSSLPRFDGFLKEPRFFVVLIEAYSIP